MTRAALALALIACGGGATQPVADPVMTLSPSAIDPAAHLPTQAEEIVFGDHVPGTLVKPGKAGKFPAIVLFQGSGPTDRDWNSPLITTKNGSGKLLAEELAAHGAVVLRFDKAGVAANTTKLEGQTIDIYVTEARAALAYVRSRPEVDTAHVYIAGHSEGGLHAIRTADQEGKALAGVLLLSTTGRTLRDILLAQITTQIENAAPGQAEPLVGPFRTAMDEFIAGKTIDPKAATPIPGLQQLLGSLTAPASATLARGLLVADPLAGIAKIAVPIFIYNGEKDVQVDPKIDPQLLANAAKANKDVTVFLAPDADHVLKHETKSLVELRADLAALESAYNSPDRGLDEATLTAIVGWLAKH
ncbi:MAG TPA: alpha/beta fold hydrolase [Kofleriaceae bacterium]|nr:alpha/beta fold hydrolase [Kofleriaceae bacterium]